MPQKWEGAASHHDLPRPRDSGEAFGCPSLTPGVPLSVPLPVHCIHVGGVYGAIDMGRDGEIEVEGIVVVFSFFTLDGRIHNINTMPSRSPRLLSRDNLNI